VPSSRLFACVASGALLLALAGGCAPPGSGTPAPAGGVSGRAGAAQSADEFVARVNGELTALSQEAQAAGFTPGIKIINVPEYTAVAALDYQQPINDKLAAVFHLSSSLIGPIEDQAYYREKLPSHNLVDLKAGVVARQWAAYITATNLTNKLAALTIDNTVFAWQQPTITRVSTNQPRTIGIDVTCKF